MLTHPSALFPVRWLFAWLGPSLSLSSHITSAGKLFLTIPPQEIPSLVILPSPQSIVNTETKLWTISPKLPCQVTHDQILPIGSTSSRLDGERRKRLGYILPPSFPLRIMLPAVGTSHRNSPARCHSLHSSSTTVPSPYPSITAFFCD